jgi:hypothetical protein
MKCPWSLSAFPLDLSRMKVCKAGLLFLSSAADTCAGLVVVRLQENARKLMAEPRMSQWPTVFIRSTKMPSSRRSLAAGGLEWEQGEQMN